MLKDKFAKLDSKSPNRITPVDLDSAGAQTERLKQIGSSKAQEKQRSAPNLTAAIQPEPRQATKPAIKQDILHTARLAGRNRGIQNALVKVAETADAPSILADLANESRSEIRMAVADNVHTPCHVKAALAQDKNIDIRFALAENHSTPLDVLQGLQDDNNPYVANRAKLTLERLKMKHLITGEFAKPDIRQLRKQA
ncbi:MAG: hypothetical protein C0507_08605 [Cyanobacteria bacterium PR.3.49]|jgi:hypothetical protein|nr:hypothetical protein [Cyanobacteria bacterium PR.3.49]